MGVLGLWRYIDDHNLSRFAGGAGSDRLEPAHILFDMNSVMHAAYSGQRPTVEQTIEMTLKLVTDIVSKYPAQKTLTFVFDGVAPIAKLATQRLRRKNNNMTGTPVNTPMPNCTQTPKKPKAATNELTKSDKKGKETEKIVGKKDVSSTNSYRPLMQAQIVTGSPFVLECEGALVKLIQDLVAQKKINTKSPVFISGCRSPGEGELKIMRRLSAIAADALSFVSPNKQSSHVDPAALANAVTGDTAKPSVSTSIYDPEDEVVVVGCDGDLILGCIAATPFHNMFLMNPRTELLTDIGELFNHWLKSGSAPLEMLPSLRVDFVFWMHLSGGDHYAGLEDGALDLWRKYRELRVGGGGGNIGPYATRPLIMNGQYQICWELLAAVLHRDKKNVMTHFVGNRNQRARKLAELRKEDESGGAADVYPGLSLLRGALWSLAGIVEGECPAPDIIASGMTAAPRVKHLRAAAARAQAQCVVPRTQYHPMPPLSVYLGAVPYRNTLPMPFRELVATPPFKNFSQLTSSGAIAAQVKLLLDTAQKAEDPANALTAIPEDIRALMTSDHPHKFTQVAVPSGAITTFVPSPENPYPNTSFVDFRYPEAITQVRISNTLVQRRSGRQLKAAAVAAKVATLTCAQIVVTEKGETAAQLPQTVSASASTNE